MQTHNSVKMLQTKKDVLLAMAQGAYVFGTCGFFRCLSRRHAQEPDNLQPLTLDNVDAYIYITLLAALAGAIITPIVLACMDRFCARTEPVDIIHSKNP